MERVKTLSLVIFLILVIGCEGLDTASGKGPALSGVKNQKFDIFTPSTLTSLQQMIAQSFNDLQNKLENRLSTLEHDLNDKIDSLDTDTGNRNLRLQNFLDTKIEVRLSQLENNLNNKIDTLNSQTENRISRLQDNIYDKIDALENRIEDEFKFIDDKIQVNSNAGTGSLESKIDDKFRQLQANLTNKTDTCMIKMRNLRDHLEAKADVFENLLGNKLNTLQDKIDIKLDNQNISNRMILLEDKISNGLQECRTEKNNDIFNHLEAMLRRSEDIQSTKLENFSEANEDNMNKTFDYLINIKSALESCIVLEEIISKNHTEGTTDVQTSGGDSTLCLPKDADITVMDPLRSTCQRGMANDTTKKYQRLELLRDNTLSRDILCDTETDGGGWIMIQRRTKGDVDFYRTWEEYKNGFGSPPGDFWLGNEAIHNLTSQGSYELRIDFNDGSQDLFAVYSSFQLEDETDNYRLRLGSHSGTLGQGSRLYGLSYSNGSQFSTHDKDNDNHYPINCAELRHGAWWYRECATSNLNGEWGERSNRGLRWYSGSTNIYASSTEMKIRLI